MSDDLPIFSFDGFYVITKSENVGEQRFYLAIAVLIVLFLIFFNFWPVWLQQLYWNSFYYMFILYFGSAALRLALWVVIYHFGFDFVLFPSFYESVLNPIKKYKLPLFKIEQRKDAWSPGSLFFRVLSGYLLVWGTIQMFSNEVVIEDLRDI